MLGRIREARSKKLYRPEYAKKVISDRLELVGVVPTPEQSLENVFKWIEASFNATKDGGSSAYYRLGSGWKASYPETTGYLIPTIYEYGHFTGAEKWRSLAARAADWLCGIQNNDGSWQGLQVDKKHEPRVFNTGMILDGLVAAYVETGDSRYLEAAKRGLDWTLTTTHDDGMFREFNVVGGGSFDLLVCACLLMVAQHTEGDVRAGYYAKIRKSLDAHLKLQTDNGWFERCNFVQDKTALLHHIGYTLDGLLISAEILEDDKYYAPALKTAKLLLSKFEVNQRLPAFFKSDWTIYNDLGSGFSQCLTGNSQVAIVFQKIAAKENDLRFLNAALKLNDIVGAIGNYPSAIDGIAYGLTGSYPINGRYQPYQFVNWAAKYHAESVLLSLGRSRSKKRQVQK